MIDELAARLGLALAIGLLVGLERGWRERDAPDRSRTAGIRTYGVAGLLGGIFGLLFETTGSPSVLVGGLLAYAAILALFKLREAIADRDYSVTGVIAGLAVFALGCLAIVGDYAVAAAGGAALAAILASRDLLHGLLRRMSWQELRAALILAVMTAIVLPLLPDRTIDPWGGVNPHEIWLFTIIVAALSYAGYAATRLLGTGRGLLISSLLGAVVSSTAVTVALARRAGDMPQATAGAAALAAAVSVTRVCLVVAAIAPAVLPEIAAQAVGAVLVFAGIGSYMVYRDRPQDSDTVPMRNPFDLAPLLGFAAGFGVIAAASAFLTGRIGETGMVAASALSAMFDVDVAVLSAVRQVDTVSMDAVANAVLLALAVNAAGRCLLAAIAGGWPFSLRYVGTSLAAFAAAALIHFA